MKPGWLVPGPEGYRTRTPLAWAIVLGVYLLVVAFVAVRSAGSYLNTDSTSAGPSAIGFLGLVVILLVAVVNCARIAVPAGRGRLGEAGLRRLGMWLLGCAWAAGLLAAGALALRVMPGSGEEFERMLLVAVACLLPVVLLASFGNLCRKATRQ